MYRPLSHPAEAWHFDMRCPPEESGRKTIDVEFTSDGMCNAVVFWFTLELIDGITISSAPGATLAPGQIIIITIRPRISGPELPALNEQTRARRHGAPELNAHLSSSFSIVSCKAG